MVPVAKQCAAGYSRAENGRGDLHPFVYRQSGDRSGIRNLGVCYFPESPAFSAEEHKNAC